METRIQPLLKDAVTIFLIISTWLLNTINSIISINKLLKLLNVFGIL